MLTFNNKVIKVGSGNVWVSNTYIPQNTMRFKMLGWDDGEGNIDETKSKVTLADLESYTTSGAGTWRQVGTDVFDFTKANQNWNGSTSSILNTLFKYTPEGGSATPLLQHYHFDVIDADLTGVTNIRWLFGNQLIHRCKLSNTSSVTDASYAFQLTTASGVADTLESVDALDFSSATKLEALFRVFVSNTNLSGTRKLSEVGTITTSSSLIAINGAFQGCNQLKALPNITDISGVLFLSSGSTSYYYYENAFYNCASAESGILAMYNKFAAAEKTPMASVFFNCGVNTTSGAAELAQVPGEWGGKLITTPSTIDALTLRMVSSNTHVGDQMPDSANTTNNRKNNGVVYKAINAYDGIWDVTIDQTSWGSNSYVQNVFTSVTGQGDCSSVTSCYRCFYNKTNLTSVCSLSFPDCTNYKQMFNGCTALTAVPSINTDVATDTSSMFKGCTAVESGALALYNQCSTQTTPPSTHSGMFTDCGSGTTSGSAELAQIPTSWGGTAT